MNKQDDIKKIDSQIQSILDSANDDYHEVIVDRKYAYDSIGDTKKVKAIKDIENMDTKSDSQDTKKVKVVSSINDNVEKSKPDYIYIIVVGIFIIMCLFIYFFIIS